MWYYNKIWSIVKNEKYAINIHKQDKESFQLSYEVT